MEDSFGWSDYRHGNYEIGVVIARMEGSEYV